MLAASERVREAALELSRTEIRAPVSGRISKRNVQASQVVSVSRALIGIAAVDELCVDANFKELQLELELGRGRGISNLDKKARITRPAPLI